MTERGHPAEALLVLPLALATLALAGVFWHWLLAPQPPFSTDIVLTEGPAPPPAAPRGLAPVSPVGATATVGFVGDIMQHFNQMHGDFRASYAPVRERLRRLDLLVGNLEFPVDPKRRAGPERGSARFNGEPAHLAALSEAGFDLLGLANNHAWDQGGDGLARTIEQVEKHGMAVLGAAPPGGRPTPLLRTVNGIRIGFQAFTIAPNGYPLGPLDSAEAMAWPPRDLPLIELNFADWQGPWREEGRAAFRREAETARQAGAEFLVAFVHWGREWALSPTPDQRLAARDMVEAGFDLVVGSHSHTPQGSELVSGRLVAYSLGNFVSDFVPLETRTGLLLAATVARGGDGRVSLADFVFTPLLVNRAGHRVTAVDSPATDEERAAEALAARLLGPGVRRSVPAP